VQKLPEPEKKSFDERNQAHGSGRFVYNDGDYEGQYIIKKHGEGRYEWADGSKYRGEWYENKINGLGAYTWADGRQYQG